MIPLAFGAFKIFVGQYFKTPMPVKPMKASGGMAIAHPESITQGRIWGSGLFTAAFWLIMGFSGAVAWLHKITAKPITRGIMLGLGLSFVLQGIGMMKEQPGVAVVAAAMTFFPRKKFRPCSSFWLSAWG